MQRPVGRRAKYPAFAPGARASGQKPDFFVTVGSDGGAAAASIIQSRLGTVERQSDT